MLIRESTTTTNDAPFHKIIEEDHQEDKGEETDSNTTPQMPLPPLIMSPYQWIYLEVRHQLTGKGEVVKEAGTKEDIKEE